MVWLFSLCIAAAGVLPWLIARRFTAAIAACFINLIVAFVIVYFGMPSIAGPLFGALGVLTVLMLAANGGIEAWLKERNYGDSVKTPVLKTLAACIPLAIFMLVGICDSTWMQATSYAALVPKIEQREWSADFQPKDPRHFRVSSPENATFLASRAIGQATTLDASGQPNAIGSQFTVEDDVSSIQIINGELWTIVPIDWNGFGPQMSSQVAGVPGYIKVSGQNPTLPAEFVRLSAGDEFQYTPEAIWGKSLHRLVWENFPDKYIADKHLEIDENGKPHYIVSMAQPTIGWWGEKVVGALIIDPVTGEGADKIIPVGSLPAWVDRVEAEYIVHRNIDYHGKYSKGFWNRSVYGSNVLAATQTHFGYGSDGQPVFATGITSQSTATGSDAKKPGSLVAVYYTNTRTGKTVEYRLNGGATEERAIEQCNLLGPVKNQGYTGTTPQLYNVYGMLSYVVPLQNSSDAFAGVCIISVMNPQVLAWGSGSYEAELAFKQMITRHASEMAIEGTHKLATVTGVVSRLAAMPIAGSTTYFVMVEGMRHAFTVPADISDKLPMTRVGDKVWIEYYDSNERVMPVNRFDNFSIELDASAIQNDVDKRVKAEAPVASERSNADTGVNDALNKLSPADRAKIEQRMRK